jgi:hypothetical protein
MQPERGQNYWEQQADESVSDKITEMYTPTPFSDDIVTTKSNEPAMDEKSDDELVRWSASEYISQDKNGLWFVLFSLAILVLIGVDLLFLQSYTFSVLVVVMAAAIVVFSRRPPRVIDYVLSGDQGLYIGERLYHFSEFKYFGMLHDGGQYSIVLIPTKRFLPGVSVYFPAEAGEQIIDILGARLPMEKLKFDIIDIIIQKLRL